MPGSIQVSVLDFKELPISSNSVKVSLGKVEHEALEKGTYSFPLTNLRDNLIISIEDSEGNQLSNSGVRTISIIEKGTWDDLFPIEGGGFVHMKLEFILSDEERNRIRLRREAAMKKKQAEILASRLKNEESAKVISSSLSSLEVSDVLKASSSQDLQRSGFNNNAKDGLSPPQDDTSVKVLESSDGINEESFQTQSFTNQTDKRDKPSFSQTTETIDQKEPVADTESRDSQTTLPNSSSNTLENFYEQTTTDNVIPFQQVEVRENLPTNNKTHNLVKKNNADSSKQLDNLIENLETQNLEEKNPNVKKTSKEITFPLFSKETEENTFKKNEIIFQESDLSKTSSRSTIAEKIKSFSPKIAGEPDKQGSSDKTSRNIKNMISVFESSIYQDRVPIKPLSTRSFRVGTSRLLKDNPVKDYYENPESSQDWLKNSKTLSSSRLRNSFSTGDLREELSTTVTKEDQVDFNNNFVEPSDTNTQSHENNPTEIEIFPKDSIKLETTETSNDEKIATVSERIHSDDIKDEKASKLGLEYFDHDSSGQRMFLDEKRHFCVTARGDGAMSLFGEKRHQEDIADSIPEIIEKGESDAIVKQDEEMVRILENSSPKNAEAEACNLSVGQAIKIALVVGFGVLVLLFRQRDSGKGKKKGNNIALRNQVIMNKRGSIQEQRRRIDGFNLS